MSYTSRNGKRPAEYASKSSHSSIIKDSDVKDFLEKCSLPKKFQEIYCDYNNLTMKTNNELGKSIQFIAAIDGGYAPIMVQEEFPSSCINFFQFGMLLFKAKDLEDLNKKQFIDPIDIEKLKNIQRYKFVLPTKNVSYMNNDPVRSVRKSFYDFFMKKDEGFMGSLKWFLYREYNPEPNQVTKHKLANCPNPFCSNKDISLFKSEMSEQFTFRCNKCNELIYLTDTFRLHEKVDDEFGADGILAYVTNLLEQMLLIHTIKLFLNIKPSLLFKTLFLKDGPLAFFGATSNMNKPMRDLTNYLLDKYDLFLAGIEKSGPFVEHAEQIKHRMEYGTILLLNNEYIYRYIIPGQANPNQPYARTSYYGGKFIYKSKNGNAYVITIPVADENVVLNPTKDDFKNIDEILNNLENLKCDMYDNALLPIAMANNLVSLSAHPSTSLLEKFARNEIFNEVENVR